MILTDVPAVSVNYRQPGERRLHKVTADEVEAFEREGHFKAGSMGPKVKAALRFVRNGGKRAIIASLNDALEALEGASGTQIVP